MLYHATFHINFPSVIRTFGVQATSDKHTYYQTNYKESKMSMIKNHSFEAKITVCNCVYISRGSTTKTMEVFVVLCFFPLITAYLTV